MNLEELIDKYYKDLDDYCKCDLLSEEEAIKAIKRGATDVHICRYDDDIKDCKAVLRQLVKLRKIRKICKDYIDSCGCGIFPIYDINDIVRKD